MENQFASRLQIRTTCGEVLPDGAVIDLIAPAATDRLEIIVRDGKQSFTSQRLERGGFMYVPPCLDPTVRSAIQFPSAAREYGTGPTFFAKVVSLFRRHLGLAEDSATFLTMWVFASWLPEYFPAPPTLCVIAASLGQAMKLFRLLEVLCRRSLVVAELSRQLPIFLRPTLLVYDGTLSARAFASWRASNYHGSHVAGKRGTLCNLACTKAVFCGRGEAAGSWGDDAMRLRLTVTEEFPPLSLQQQAQMAAEFQPQFEHYRLVQLQQIPQPDSASGPSGCASFELARNLFACVPDAPAIAQTVAPLLQCHAQELLARSSLDPDVAIVEALWGPAHNQREISSSAVTTRVNGILRSRGETYAYNSYEIGWKLRDLRLDRHHNGTNKVVQFTKSEMRRRIHQLAHDFGLSLPAVATCSDCREFFPSNRPETADG